MTRRTRRIVFYILVALFIIIGTAVVLYADGWRIDLATFHTEKVGGIYVRAFPQNAAITLSGAAIPNQSNFLSHGTLISNLYPKNYTLGLSLPGYDAWKENADVSPSLVVEMKYAVLVPQTSTVIATTSNVTDFFDIGSDHVDARANGTIAWRNLVIATGTIVSHSTDLKNMIYRSPAGNYFLYDFPTQKTESVATILQKQRVTAPSVGSIIIDPYNDTTALAVTPNRVLSIDLVGQTASVLGAASSGRTFAPMIAASQPFLAWSTFTSSSGTSRIAIYDKFSDSVTEQSPAIPGTTKLLAWIDADTLGIVQNDGSLYRYTVSSNSMNSLASDVKSFYPTPDGNMLAALENQSIEIFDFANNDYYRFNIPDMSSIQGLSWYKDESHLFVDYPNRVVFFDLADTSLANLITVSPGAAPTYDPQANALFLVNAGNVLRFSFPN